MMTGRNHWKGSQTYTMPAIDPMFMTRPSLRFIMEGTTAFETRTAAKVLSSNAFLICSIVTSTMAPIYKIIGIRNITGR